MKSGGSDPFKGDIEVDGYYVGGLEAAYKGRENKNKQLAAMAIQTDSFDIHRYNAKVILSALCAELQVFFDQHIAQDAKIRADGWTRTLLKTKVSCMRFQQKEKHFL